MAAVDWSSQNVVVTGGCGFIGRHLVRRLVALGATVTVIDDLSSGDRAAIPDSVTFVEGSIVDRPLVKRVLAGKDGCFHLAAIASVTRSMEDLVGTAEVNEIGTLSVLEALKDSGGRLVYASSSAVFGPPAELPLVVGSPTNPISPYGVSKLVNEMHAKVAGLAHGTPSYGLRFFNVYGPEQSATSPYSGVIALFARKITAGQGFTIHGTGEQTRDFVFVADVVEGILKAWTLASPDAPRSTVGTGQPTSVRDLAHILMDVCGRTVPVEFGPARAGDIPHSYGLGEFLTETVGIVPRPLRDGLSLTLAAAETSP